MFAFLLLLVVIEIDVMDGIHRLPLLLKTLANKEDEAEEENTHAPV